MINVRAATIDDVDSIHELILAIAKHHHQERFVVTDKQELIASGFSQTPRFGMLLAEVDAGIAGYLSYTWNYSIWLGAQYMNIDDVFVWEQYRSRGIGEALMEQARQVCKDRGCSRLRWEVQQDNTRAMAFYRRLGAEIDIKGICRWSADLPA